MTDLLGKMEIVLEAREEPAHTTVMKKAVKQNETGAVLDARIHTELFAQAMKVFSKGDYKRAGEMFERAAAGPVIGVNESAQMYSRMCQQRMSSVRVELKTSEDHYNYAVSLINARKYREARESLETAMASGLQPHFCYALALVEGHLGAMELAASHLKRAIQMDPALRSVARSDPDFTALLQNPKLREAMAAVAGTGG